MSISSPVTLDAQQHHSIISEKTPGFCRHEKLEVVKGDVFDADSITPVLEGKNAVMSCLGFQVGAKTLYSKSITSIIAAAER